MIFTTIPTPPSAQVSELFREHGNTADCPAPISKVSVYGITAHTPFAWRSFCSMLGFHVVATARRTSIRVGAMKGYDFLALPLDKDLTAPPRIAISPVDKFSERAITRFEQLGLLRQVRRGQTQYHGTVQTSQLASLMSFGIEVKTYVTSGITNIKGLLAWNITQKIITGILLAIPSSYGKKRWFGTSLETDGLGDQSVYTDTANNEIKYNAEGTKLLSTLKAFRGKHVYGASPAVLTQIRIQNDANLLANLTATGETQGVFMPYFPRMLLPDKEFVPRFLVQYTRCLLGVKIDDQMRNITTLDQGWTSLSDTDAGMILTHMAYVIDIGLQVCAKPVIMESRSGEYIGMVLLGQDFSIFKHGVNHETIALGPLVEEIQSFDSHEDALHTIASILSAAKLADEEGQTEDVSTGTLTSVRAIHKEAIRRIIPPEVSANFSKALRKLNFRQVYWDVASVSRLRFTMEAIATGTTLPAHEPMLPRLDVILNKNNVMSTLAAYGHMAPVLFVEGGRIITIPRAGEPKIQDTPRRGAPNLKLFPGFAIYSRALVQAVESWKHVTESHQIGVQLTPQGTYYRATSVKSGAEAEGLYDLLTKLFAPPVIKPNEKGKRKLDPQEDAKTRDERSKRRRVAAEEEANELAQLLRAQGMVPPESSDEEEAADEDAMEEEEL